MSIPTGLPPSVLAEIPAGSPPDGQLSNFVDPPSIGPAFVTVGAIVTAIMMVFVMIRFYAKTFIVKKLSPDDWTCLIATIAALIVYGFEVVGVTQGVFGRHQWDVSLLDLTKPEFYIPTYVTNWMSSIAVAFAKSTFFLLYLQIFAPFKGIRWAIYIGLGFTIIWYTVFTIAQLYLLTPENGEGFIKQFAEQRQLDTLKISIPITAGSVFIDFYAFVIPIIGVSKLQLSRKRKFGVLLIFLTGFIACIASTISLIFKIILQNKSNDSIYYGLDVLIAVYVEICLGVACTCMPSTAKVLRQHLPALDFIKSALSKPFASLGSTRASGEKHRGGLLGSYSRKRNFARTESSDGINTKESMAVPHPPWQQSYDGSHNVELRRFEGMHTHVVAASGKPAGKRRPSETGGIHLRHDVQQTWQNTPL